MYIKVIIAVVLHGSFSFEFRLVKCANLGLHNCKNIGFNDTGMCKNQNKPGY